MTQRSWADRPGTIPTESLSVYHPIPVTLPQLERDGTRSHSQATCSRTSFIVECGVEPVVGNPIGAPATGVESISSTTRFHYWSKMADPLVVINHSNWDNGGDITRRRARTELVMLLSISTNLPSTLFLTLYYSLLYPYIDYGIALWGVTNEMLVNKINVIQNKCNKHSGNS